MKNNICSFCKIQNQKNGKIAKKRIRLNNKIQNAEKI